MGFEAPLALLGLAAAAIPVIVHLMRRRDLPRIELPTVALLRRAQVQSRRRMRLVDLLLLIARMLLIVLLALGVAGPYATARVAWGDGRIASVAIVIDDSMSMARQAEGGTALSIAGERARRAIGALPEGSEVAVVLAGKPARLLVPRTRDLEAAAARVARLPRTSGRATDLGGGVARAMRELGGAAHDVRRLLVLSDFAAHAGADDVRWPGRDVAVDVERIGGERDANRAIVAAPAVPDPTTPGQASIAVEVRAFSPSGTDPSSSEPVRVVLADASGRELAAGEVTLAGSVGRTTLHAPMPREGDATATLRLRADDPLAVDDARGVLLRTPASVRVLVVDGDPHPTRAHDEVRFLARALDLVPEAEGSVAYQTVDPDTFATRELAGWDVVVIANAPAPPGRAARRLADFVAGGGGLLVAAGDRVEPQAWVDALGEILPARPRAAVRGEPIGLGTIAMDSDVLPPGGAGLGAVVTRERLLLEPTAQSRTLIEFADGSPALVWGRHRQGRVAMLATTADDDWTDLPYRPGFLPLIARLVRGLAPPGAMPDRAFEPGSTVRVPVPPGATRVVVIDPDGDEQDFTGDELGERIEVVPEAPGAYRVLVAEGAGGLRDVSRAAFLVAPPAIESDLAAAPLPPRLAVTGSDEQALGRGAVVRRPLAPSIFLLAGIAFVLEALLRHRRPMRTPATT